LSTARISGDEHQAWFARRLQDPDCLLFIAEEASGLPIGQVRFDVDRARHTAIVSISVDALTRGSGVGRAVLAAGLRAMAGHAPGMTVVADVVQENARSVRLFASAGFVEQASSRPGVRRFEYRGVNVSGGQA
jgi:RimJ/RimL family protein N-acetyltransferase